MACFPNSWAILLYRFVTSYVIISWLGSIYCGLEFFKILSLIKLFNLFRKSYSKMTISLLNLFVGYDGLAIRGLDLGSLWFGISIYSDFCVSTALLICFDF